MTHMSVSANPLVFVVAAALFTVVPACGEVFPSILDVAAPSVLRIEARNCNYKSGSQTDRTGTGFVWRDKNTVVTALHVVSGCGNLSAVYQMQGNIARTATVIKIMRRADLALLSIADAPQAQPLTAAPQQPSVEAKLEVLGFSLQIPKMSSTTLSLRFGGNALQDIIPPSVKLVLDQDKSPDPALEITNIEGHLLPGLSGAPIMNEAGGVVAIGDGGLDNGTVGISWGIPVRFLPQLAVSQENASSVSVSSSPYKFATESEAKVLGQITCSGYQLTKVRTSTFQQIAPTTDDPLGLQQLVNYFNMDPNGGSFDIYQHLPSGATVTVPSGAVLHSDTNGCIASMHNGDFTFRVELVPVSGAMDAQAKSMVTEQHAVGSPLNWYTDNAFTYAQPVPRFDQMIVRRRGYVHLDPALVQPNTVPQDRYLFETIATRGDVLISVSVINNISTIANNQAAIMCRLAPAGNGCADMNIRSEQWIRSVIAVHLATFSVG